MRLFLSAFLLAAIACGTSPCQELDARCASCGQDRAKLEACKQAATLLSSPACEQVLKALASGACPSAQDILLLFPSAPGSG